MVINKLLSMIDEESLPTSKMLVSAEVQKFTIEMDMITGKFYQWLEGSDAVESITSEIIAEGVAHGVKVVFCVSDNQIELIDFK